jgi:hypothetical protein
MYLLRKVSGDALRTGFSRSLEGDRLATDADLAFTVTDFFDGKSIVTIKTSCLKEVGIGRLSD